MPDALEILRVLLESPPVIRNEWLCCLCAYCGRDLTGLHWSELHAHADDCPWARAKEMLEANDG